MLSFNDYIWESRMANLRRQIATNLIASGQTLEEVVKAIISEKRVQNEFFGGFVQRLGNAWNALWTDPNEAPKYTGAQVMQFANSQNSQLQAEIQRLMNQIHKTGGNKDVEHALYEIMKKTGGQHYDMMKQIDAQERAGKKFKPGGIMDETYKLLDKLRDLSQDPRIPPKDRAEQIEQFEQALDAHLKKAQGLVTSATDPTDKAEAESAVDILTNNPKFKEIRDSIDKMKASLKGHLGGATKALSGGGTEDYHAVRNGSSGASIPPNASPKEAIAAIASMNGADKTKALEAWYNGLSDAAKKDLSMKISGKPDWVPTGKIGQMLFGALSRPEINAKL